PSALACTRGRTSRTADTSARWVRVESDAAVDYGASREVSELASIARALTSGRGMLGNVKHPLAVSLQLALSDGILQPSPHRQLVRAVAHGMDEVGKHGPSVLSRRRKLRKER